MAARKIFISVAVALALLAGCAASQGGGLFGHPKNNNEHQAKLAERIRLLDIDWEIIRKDDPPQPDTVGFRGSISDANKALAEGRLDAAEKALAEAEAWMAQARPSYYREHESRVVAGSSKETSDQFIASALALKEKGQKAREAGDKAGAQKYFEAAVEEGELAVAAAGRTLQGPYAFTRLVEQMSSIYAAAGHPERSSELRGRLVRSMQDGINASGRQLQERLDNKAPGFDPDTLTKDKAAVDSAIAELNRLNDQYRRQVEYANAFAPGAVRSADYGPSISAWSASWLKVHEPPQLGNPGGNHDHNGQDLDIVKQCNAARAAHNQLKEGAQSIASSGIVLEESEIYTQGAQVLIRGKVQNLRSQPILDPRITVTGGVMSKVVDLGYTSMSPLHSTTFIVALECYSAEAYNRTMNQVPAHELLLIFKEPNGIERKLIQPVGVSTGN